jgi:RNA polymerase sigma-70 factor, ECF subfamily
LAALCGQGLADKIRHDGDKFCQRRSLRPKSLPDPVSSFLMLKISQREIFSTYSPCGMLSELSFYLDASLQNQTDAELIFALRDGQTPAMGVLYDRHSGLVYGLALKVLGNAQEAEDLTQEVFIALVKSTAYDPQRGSLRTFLAILTKSRALDRLRSRSSARQLIARWQQSKTSESTPNIPLEQAFQQEQSQEVRAALAQLPATEQQVLRLAYYDGFSQSEIAQQLALPLGTVKTRARRGLLKLRQFLAPFTE